MQQRTDPTISTIDLGDLYHQPTAHTVSESLNEPRRPWIAVLLGVFLTPVAFAYVGRPFWGVALYTLYFAMIAWLAVTGAMHSVAGLWLLYATVLVFQVAAIILPWLFARKARRNYAHAWCNAWYVYLLAAGLLAPIAYVQINKDRFFGFATYRIPTSSMAPTIERGELVLADTRAATVAALKTNDVAIYRSRKTELQYVKRIVALPGQSVHIDTKGVTVDGIPEKRVAAIGSDMLSEEHMHFADVTLGADEFYMLGDNRSNSEDSRTDGPVKRADLVGRATTIFYSIDRKRIGPIH
jgi:signal peptidase I